MLVGNARNKSSGTQANFAREAFMTIRIITLVTGLLLAAGTIQAADWTYWRGPEQNGISREKGLVDVWSLGYPVVGSLHQHPYSRGSS